MNSDKMKRVLATAGVLVYMSSHALAGGLLTNTNQNVAFLRNPARDASIGIDGVYSNPAGVVFLSDGIHLSINVQNAHQTRTVTSNFAPFAYGYGNDGATTKNYKGVANAPVIPSLQAAYNKGDWSFQFNFAITGGGGKCEFEEGLGSFESSVSLLPLLSRSLPTLTSSMGLGDVDMPTIDGYKMDTYMRGRQYYYGFTFGAARKLNDNLSVYAGIRALYGTANYYGYVKNIEALVNGEWEPASESFKKNALVEAQKYGAATAAAQSAAASGDLATAQEQAAVAKNAYIKSGLYQALGTATEDVELNCDQWGVGFAPIVGVDYKIGTVNLAAKYEFKTRMRLHNKSANSESASNLDILDKYADGEKVQDDSPALLTVGAQWSIIPSLRLSAGWHHFFDKNGHMYNHHEKSLNGDTDEYLAGVEYDVTKWLEASCGFQKTNYDFTDNYMEDISFNVSSWSFGVGVGIKIKDNMKLNLAYFQTNYDNYNSATTSNYNDQASIAAGIVGSVVSTLAQSEEKGAAAAELTSSSLISSGAVSGSNSYTRTNRVFGIGLDIDF